MRRMSSNTPSSSPIGSCALRGWSGGSGSLRRPIAVSAAASIRKSRGRSSRPSSRAPGAPPGNSGADRDITLSALGGLGGGEGRGEVGNPALQTGGTTRLTLPALPAPGPSLSPQAGGEGRDFARRHNSRGRTLMRRSADHILTSHAGSLPRPDQLIEAWGAGDEPRLARTLAALVAEVVRSQKDIGIDVPGDGEFGKPM